MPQSRSVPPPVPAEPHEVRLNRLRRLSYILDNSIPIPGTDRRVGIDPILGLLPGAGDFLGTAFSAYIVLEAALLGLPRASLLRMVSNILFETLVGTVPVLGDLFDVAWKANAKNMALLETHMKSPQSSKKADWWFIVLLLGGLMLVVTAITAIGVFILSLLWRAITGG